MLRLLVILTFLSQTARAQNDEAGIKQAINQLFEGMRRSDTAMIRSAFAPGAILQTIVKNKSGNTIVETEPLDSFVAAVGKPHVGIYDERISFETIKSDGLLASAWTPYQFYVDDRFSHCGIDAYQLININGTWKIQYLVDTRRREGCK